MTGTTALVLHGAPMPLDPSLRFTAASPSRIADWEECAYRAFLKHLQKLCTKCFKGKIKGGYGKPMKCTACPVVFTESEGTAKARGDQIHEAIRDYISGRSNDWYEEMNSVAYLIDEYREKYRTGRVKLEYELGLTKEWTITGYFDKNVYLRLKLDLVEFPENGDLAKVVDWKSGKFRSADEIRGDYDDALNLYSTGILSLGLSQRTESKLVFTDYGDIVNRPRGRLSLPVLAENQRAWDRRIFPMMQDDTFSKCPGRYCNWCDYAAKKGGPCEFGT